MTTKITPIFAWYDFWVGWFWDRAKRRLYIFPVPMFGAMVQFKDHCSESSVSNHDYEA